MRQHEKSHTGEQKLRCRLCPKKYSDPSVLKEHLRNRHGIEPDDQEMSAFVKDSEEKAHLRNEFQVRLWGPIIAVSQKFHAWKNHGI